MANLRFCAYQYQHLPLEELRDRWRAAEDLGFDVLWNCDTVVEPDRRQHTIIDGPATLTMMAAATTLTKAAMTLDHLSGGRVEVALGVGDPSAERGRREWIGRRGNESRDSASSSSW